MHVVDRDYLSSLFRCKHEVKDPRIHISSYRILYQAHRWLFRDYRWSKWREYQLSSLLCTLFHGSPHNNYTVCYSRWLRSPLHFATAARLATVRGGVGQWLRATREGRRHAPDTALLHYTRHCTWPNNRPCFIANRCGLVLNPFFRGY